MKNIGSTLLILGVGTIVLNMFGYEFRILMWVDAWGETVGWAIRGGIIVVGAILFFLGWRAEQGAPEAVAEAPRQEPTMQAPPPAPAPESPEAKPATDPMGSLHNT